MKIIKYTQVMSRTSSELISKINDHIKLGWELWEVVFKDEDGWFVQAMVQRESDQEEAARIVDELCKGSI